MWSPTASIKNRQVAYSPEKRAFWYLVELVALAWTGTDSQMFPVESSGHFDAAKQQMLPDSLGNILENWNWGMLSFQDRKLIISLWV